MLTATKTTCTCIPEVPWECVSCYTARRDREQLLKSARNILKGIRIENRCHLECAREGHAVRVCRCAGFVRLEGVEMYREALNLARSEARAFHAA